MSKPQELPPQLLAEPDLNLSTHPAPIIQPTVSIQASSSVETTTVVYGQSAPTSSVPVSDACETFYI